MPAKSIKSTRSLRSSTKVHPQDSLQSNTTNGNEPQPDHPGIKSTSSAKHDAYTEALKRSLMESQIERDFLSGAALSRYNTGVEDHNLFSANSTMSERMLTATTGFSFATTGTAEGREIEDIVAEDFPEFRIETAIDKMKVNLTDDLLVSLTPRDDSKPGINASWQSIAEMRTDIFESRLAEKCIWFDLSGNSLQYDSYAKEENVLGTVKSRKHTPGQVPDMWTSFQNLQYLTFGQSCSEESTCKRGNLLRNIPISIFTLTSLRVLSFSSNHLQDILPEVANLVNLEKLSLDDNELMEFQPALLDLPKLRFLDLDNNSLEQVELNTLPRHLRCLRLKGNNISHIALLPCRNSLQQLDLSCNNLKNIDHISFKCLVKLKYFDLSSNVIEKVPSSIGKLENLRKLYLDDNMLEQLTPSICLLQKLNVLNLSENSLTELPPDIGNLGMLRELHVENNELETLPGELERITRLLTLCLSGNKLVAIPPVIARLFYLRDLLLFNNKIRKLDMSLLAPCRNLVVLGLAMNRIKVIPPEIAQLESIRIIQLDGNRLTAIPDGMSEVKTLKYLSLSNNRIEYIPDSLSSLSNLVGLLMDGNSLTEVPTSIGQLQNLRVLSVKHNYIETIPESISLLVNIELMDVCDNKLTRLPTTISEFNERVELKANNNQLTLPPQQVADKGIISIKAFLDSHGNSVEVESVHSEFETTAI